MRNKRIIVTGCNGLLGQTLVNMLSTNPAVEVIGFAKGPNRNETTCNFEYVEIDLTDFKALAFEIDRVKPTEVINCAAITNVDLCETEHALCDMVNVVLVEELVRLIKPYNTHLVHLSTDFIFDGADGPYHEEAKANPLNYYGKSKLKSERIVQQSGISYTIIRTILVYGMVDQMEKPTIVLWIKEAVEQGRTLTIVDDQFRMPTYVIDLAKACIEAVEKRIHGVFHVSSSEMMSIYDVAIAVCEAFELDSRSIKRISTAQLNQTAKRPVRTGFDLVKSRNVFELDFEPFKSRLLAFVKSLN
ncbi:SDR family oxidoreductase [Flavobacteriaceae bacterium F08102]|nr:SDR family oxidoreductase [Flavobacteriaceae bacterium F08102]